MKTVALVAAALALALGCAQVDLPTESSPDGIRVSGTGKVNADPDIARVRIGVETFDEEVAAAVVENNSKAARIIDALKAAGVADADVGTSGFNVSAQRDFRQEGPDNVVGFQVTNTVAVTMRDIDAIGEVLQAALDAGANNIHGFTLGVDDADALRQEARVKAVEDARARAQVMADAAGVTLGAATSITEGSVGVPTVRLSFDSAVAESGVPIAPGELEVTVTVQVLFAIE
jgi:uncharacterized protein YggE